MNKQEFALLLERVRMAYIAAHKPFVPSGDQMAKHLETTGGALAPLHVGRLFKYGSGDWDMAHQWVGRDLVKWKAQKSLWDKGTHINFYSNLNASLTTLPMFKLTLAADLSEEDVAQAAETYMMLLNLRRVE